MILTASHCDDITHSEFNHTSDLPFLIIILIFNIYIYIIVKNIFEKYIHRTNDIKIGEAFQNK